MAPGYMFILGKTVYNRGNEQRIGNTDAKQIGGKRYGESIKMHALWQYH